MSESDNHPHHDTAATERQARLRAWFDQAQDVPEQERREWMQRQVSDGEERAALGRLLAAAESAGPLDVSLDERASRIGSEATNTGEGLIGSRIGAFRLERLLGQGGMATVFLGRRDHGDFDQQVALKLLRRGLYSDVEQRLFRREQKALATLSHPHIAHLVDGGITPAGIPYLAIEYIDGVPITRHADDGKLDARSRLQLFVVVCDAVAAAHRALIVHRDLKPSNILVDRDGSVKLLDFGIAKLLAEDDDDRTRTGHAALTPGYAAPEQYRGGVISTATDVHALGVLLHELLTGERPSALSASAPDGERWVRDNDTIPVTRIRGDLGNIVAKARAEEPGRRYASARELGDDIGRYLDAQPVQAHPPSGWYRTRKFVQRHRGGVVLASLFALGVLVSLVIALMQTARAQREAVRANQQTLVAQQEAQHATAVRDFVETLFSPISDGVAERKLPTVTELVGRGVERLDQDTALAPAARVDLMMMFARLHDRLGDNARGRELGLAADAFARQHLAADDPAAIAALALRGIQAVHANDHAAAEAPLREALARARVGGRDDPSLISILDNLAVLEMDRGKAETALDLEREALQVRIDRHGADAKQTAAGYNNLGYGLVGLGRYAEAAPAYQRAWEIDVKHLQPDSLDVLSDLSNWGWALALDGQLREARAKLAEAEAGFRNLGGKPKRLQVYNSQKLCGIDIPFAAPAVAQETCSAMLAVTREQTGGSGVFMGYALRLDAQRLIESGDLDAAEHRLDEAWQQHPDEPEQARGRIAVLHQRAVVAWLSAQPAKAVEFGLAAQSLINTISDASMTVLNVRAVLVLACRSAPQPGCAEAATAFDADLDRRRDSEHPGLLLVRVLQARVQISQQDNARAVASLDQALLRAAREVPAGHPLLATARLWRAVALAASGQCREADQERASVLVGLPNGPAAKADEGRAPVVQPWLREAIDTPLPACPAR